MSFATETLDGADIRGLYRYRLWRTVNLAAPDRDVVFVMLNPSTADARDDDPTIRRCKAFAAQLGYRRLVVVNLFAWRATDPRMLLDASAPVGEPNDSAILEAAVAPETGLVIAAWGAVGHRFLLHRATHVLGLLEQRVDVYALGKTKHSQPRHPLYLRGDARPEIYRRRM